MRSKGIVMGHLAKIAILVVAFALQTGTTPAEESGDKRQIAIDAAEADASTWAKLRKLPEYKREYKRLKAIYDGLLEATQDMREDLQSTLRLIEAHESNLKSLEEIWTARQRAWKGIYQEQRSGRGDRTKTVDSGPASRDSGEPALPDHRRMDRPEAEPSPPWWNRYQVWHARLKTMVDQHNRLKKEHSEVKLKLEQAEKRLHELQMESDALKGHIIETTKAWKRIYEE